MDELIKFASQENIQVVYLPLNMVYKELFGIHIPGERKIVLDTRLLMPKYYRLWRCVMGEELGHHFTGISHNIFKVHYNYSLKRKMNYDDELALRWATDKLIPTDEITSLLDGGFSDCEGLAEYFGVTIWFIFRKLEFLQLKNSNNVKNIREYIKSAKISCF